MKRWLIDYAYDGIEHRGVVILCERSDVKQALLKHLRTFDDRHVKTSDVKINEITEWDACPNIPLCDS